MKKEYLFSEEELTTLRSVVDSVKSHLPTDKTHLIWDSYVRIKGKSEPRPCTCPSSGHLWKKAIETIRTYLKDN